MAHSCDEWVDKVYSLTRNTLQKVDAPQAEAWAKDGRRCYEASDSLHVDRVVWLLQQENLALIQQDKYTEATTVYDYYVTRYAGQGQDISQAYLLLNTIHSYTLMGQASAALALTIHQEHVIQALPVRDQALYYINLSAALMSVERYRLALQQAQQALQLAKRSGAEDMIAHATLIVGEGYIKYGDYDIGRTLLVEADSLHRTLQNFEKISTSLAIQGESYQRANNPLEALPYYEQALSLTRQHHLPRSEVVARYRRARSFLTLDQPQEVLEDVERALFIADSTGIYEFNHWLYLLQAEANRDLHDYLAAHQAHAAGVAFTLKQRPPDASAFFAEAQTLGASLPGPLMRYFHAYWPWLILGVGFVLALPTLMRTQGPPSDKSSLEPIKETPAGGLLPKGWVILGAIYRVCFRWPELDAAIIGQVREATRSLEDQGAVMMMASLLIDGPLQPDEDLHKRSGRAWQSIKRLFKQYPDWGSMPNKRLLWARWFQEQGWDQEPPEEIRIQMQTWQQTATSHA